MEELNRELEVIINIQSHDLLPESSKVESHLEAEGLEAAAINDDSPCYLVLNYFPRL